MKTNTPRTDALMPCRSHPAMDLARKLEMENNNLRELLEEAEGLFEGLGDGAPDALSFARAVNNWHGRTTAALQEAPAAQEREERALDALIALALHPQAELLTAAVIKRMNEMDATPPAAQEQTK